MRYRLADLVWFVAFFGAASGLTGALVEGRLALGTVCFLGSLALLVVLATRPKVGARRCSYCGRWGLTPGDEKAPACDECGSTFVRVDGRTLALVSCPADERLWVRKFLPKLRRLRTDLRPGPCGGGES